MADIVSTGTTFGQRFARNSTNDPYKVLIIANDGGNSPAEGSIRIEAFLPEEVNIDVQASYDAPFSQGLNQAMPGLGSMARAFGVNLTTQAMTAQVWQGGTEVQFSMNLVFQAERSSYLDVMKPIKDLFRLTMPKDPSGGGLLESPGPHVNIDKLKTPIGSPSSPGIPTPQKPSTESTSGNGLGDLAVTAGFDALSSLGAGVSGLWEAGKTVVRGAGDMAGAVIGKDTGLNPGGFIGSLVDVGASVTKSIRGNVNNTLVNLSATLVNSIEGNISLYIGNFIYIPSIVITDVSPTFNVILGPDGNPMRASVQVSFKMFYIPTQDDIETMFWNRGGAPTQARSA